MADVHRSPKLLACCLLALLLLAIGAGRGPVASAYALLNEPPASGAAPARITTGASVRSGPGDGYLVLSVAQAGEEHAILGRSSDGLWWRIDFRGQPAWVAAAQVETRATDVPVVRIGGDPL